LGEKLGFSRDSVVADIGSGTGIFAELLLQNGNTVFGIEPNDDMRTVAEANLRSYKRFKSIKGSAESTTLPSASVDFITAAQSFHWFDHASARVEFLRILRKPGWVVLAWNTRRKSTPFLQAYDRLVRGKAFEGRRASHEDLPQTIFSNFLGNHLRTKLSNSQECDEEALKGRVMSASYSPLLGDPLHQEALDSVSQLFSRYQVNGRVTFEYDTEVYAGQLR
jgi:ubiquinone/menaquinone biosynthesis C-methylase UbiE